MASTNQSPFYQRAEQEYLEAQTTGQKIICLEKMISLAPQHKGAEKMRANLKTRLAKLKCSKEKEIRSGKSTQKGIRKSDMQAIIIGLTNSGKSSLLKALTNSNTKISEIPFTTSQPELGTLDYNNVNIQIIESPAIDSGNVDHSLIHTADVLINLITSIKDLEKIKPLTEKSIGKQIVVFNKIDLYNESELRKIKEQLKSKRIKAIMISSKTKQGIQELTEKLFPLFNKTRIYLKEPWKKASVKPLILEENSTIEQAIEKVKKGLSKNIKDIRIWGPSSKFSGQSVGLKHILKDLDTLEFKTK